MKGSMGLTSHMAGSILGVEGAGGSNLGGASWDDWPGQVFCTCPRAAAHNMEAVVCAAGGRNSGWWGGACPWVFFSGGVPGVNLGGGSSGRLPQAPGKHRCVYGMHQGARMPPHGFRSLHSIGVGHTTPGLTCVVCHFAARPPPCCARLGWSVHMAVRGARAYRRVF
jgi:hypothetical protein